MFESINSKWLAVKASWTNRLHAVVVAIGAIAAAFPDWSSKVIKQAGEVVTQIQPLADPRIMQAIGVGLGVLGVATILVRSLHKSGPVTAVSEPVVADIVANDHASPDQPA